MDTSGAFALDTASLGALSVGLIGGLALFLHGLNQMSEALRLLAGSGIRTLLARLTRNRATGVLSGALITALIQSSSVTTVLLVGFISAGLMTLQQSVAVIMGANIGTTITAQVIAFNVTDYGLLLIAAGFLLSLYRRQDQVRHTGNILMGLGLLFFGMGLMSQATEPLRHYSPFLGLMRDMQYPPLLLLLGMLFTALVQSSSATTGIAIVFASQGFLSLESGILLTLGANVGTCITALLAALGKKSEAMQAAIVHVLFNLAGVLIWLPLIYPLAELVRWLSPAAPELTGMARLAAETPRQIANAHTVFNALNTLLFIGFTGRFADTARRLFPGKPAPATDSVKPRFLEPVYLQTPPLALDRIRLELGHLGQRVLECLDRLAPDNERPIKHRLEPLQDAVQQVDTLYAYIIDYERQLSRREMTAAHTRVLDHLTFTANHLSNASEVILHNLAPLLLEWENLATPATPRTRELYRELFAHTRQTVATAVQAVEQDDPDLAHTVIEAKTDLLDEADTLSRHLGDRLRSGDPDRVALFRVESQVSEVLNRLYVFARRIAKLVLADHTPAADEAPAAP